MPQTAPLTSHTTSAWSADGFVEVQVRAGRVQQVYVDPHWRSTQLEQVVERSIAEATNIALNQQTQQVYEALYRAAPSGDLARNLTRAAADVEYGAGRGAELPGALRELGTVLQQLEDADFMPEQLEPPAPPVLGDVLALPRLPKTLWLQLGLRDEAVAAQARTAGLQVVMDRCIKVDHARWR